MKHAVTQERESYRIKLFEYYLSINPKVSFMVVCSGAFNILVLRAADTYLSVWLTENLISSEETSTESIHICSRLRVRWYMTNGSSWKSSLTRNAALRDKTPHQRFLWRELRSHTAFVKLGSRMHSWWVMKRFFAAIFDEFSRILDTENLKNFTVKWIYKLHSRPELVYRGSTRLWSNKSIYRK